MISVDFRENKQQQTTSTQCNPCKDSIQNHAPTQLRSVFVWNEFCSCEFVPLTVPIVVMEILSDHEYLFSVCGRNTALLDSFL